MVRSKLGLSERICKAIERIRHHRSIGRRLWIEEDGVSEVHERGGLQPRIDVVIEPEHLSRFTQESATMDNRAI